MAEHEVTVTEVRKPIPFRLIITIVVLILLAVFVLVNNDEVTIEFALFDVETYLSLALVISALLGFIVGLFVPRLRR